MIQAGADPRIKAADGSDAMAVLRLTQKVQPDSARLALIEHILASADAILRVAICFLSDS